MITVLEIRDRSLSDFVLCFYLNERESIQYERNMLTNIVMQESRPDTERLIINEPKVGPYPCC